MNYLTLTNKKKNVTHPDHQSQTLVAPMLLSPPKDRNISVQETVDLTLTFYQMKRANPPNSNQKSTETHLRF